MRNFRFLALYSLLALSSLTTRVAMASDHDDGERDLKGRGLSLTDLYVFREDWQDSEGKAENLVLVMNTNPRSLARQQYYFSTQAHYEFHLTRLTADKKKTTPTGREDIVLRFKFGAPDSTGHQKYWLNLLRPNENPRVLMDGTTTALNDPKPRSTKGKVDNTEVTVFAGLREDPFFFDVERYFRIRGFLATGVNTLGAGPIQGGANVFRSDATAVDFAAGYNVNSIVVKIPISVLQSKAKETVFDVWETISVPKEGNIRVFEESVARFKLREPRFVQIERLGRPAINEGLVISNDLLNAYNSVPPTADLSAAAKPVLAEAGAVLTAVYNYGTKAGLPAPKVEAVVAGFIPDVMRIDTALSFPPGKWAYNADAVTVEGKVPGAMLTGGRKIEDDVMDITLSYLIAGNPACSPEAKCAIPDGVSYAGGTDCANAGTGTNPSNPGHKCLNEQTARNGSAKFPYLASPN